MGARVSSASLPLAGDAGSLRPRSRRPVALRLENEFEQGSRADLTPLLQRGVQDLELRRPKRRVKEFTHLTLP